MYLDKLILTNFKNYELQTINCSDKINCLVGFNGMGKTNLLDAIYYICMGKSYFGTPDSSIVKKEEDFFRLEAHFKVESNQEKVVAKVIPRKKKTFEHNEIPYQKLSEHIGLLPIVIVAPDDTSLINEGSEIRRKFLNNTLSQLDQRYLKELISYNKILQQRNAALKQFADQQQFNGALLQAYNKQLSPSAQYIFEKRKSFLAKFCPILSEMHKFISGKSEIVDLNYRSDLEQNDFISLLESQTQRDRILTRTTKGIHKDELIFTIDGYPMKRFGSQGQLKTFVLALKLAQYELLKLEKQIKPILLLDDIFDKLDRKRVQYLLQLLTGGDFGQIFITDTHDFRVEEIIQQFASNYIKFTISNGNIAYEKD